MRLGREILHSFMEPFIDNLQHILAELERLDVLIRTQVLRARQLHTADEHFQGLYVSEQEIDTLLSEPAGLPRWAIAPADPSLDYLASVLEEMASINRRRCAASQQHGVTLRLDELARRFQLSPFAVDVLLVCLAPEIDLRYERLFGYLQDDITKRRPSVDLTLNLLAPSLERKLAERRHFLPDSPLCQYHLVTLFDDPSYPQPPLLGRFLRADRRIVDFLLGADDVDERLRPFVQVERVAVGLASDPLLAGVIERLLAVGRQRQAAEAPLIFYFHGPNGVGKRHTARALCGELARPLLVVDGPSLLNAGEPTFAVAARLILREALLHDAVLYWRGFETLLADEQRAACEQLLGLLAEHPGLSILAGDSAWEPMHEDGDLPFIQVEFRRPTYRQRRELWPQLLEGKLPLEDGIELDSLASQFRFTAGQIRAAAATARNLARSRNPQQPHVTEDDLHTACRLQSNRKLAELARKITPHYGWDEIVLPADRIQQLREIVNQVKHRGRVYEEWGFDRKLAMGKGLNVLFAGPSGTGKTMAADIMAGELRLDLYKIDLSSVVSKYIGETEKNLARIFQEAETSNAILFFDEADALFGKRSEVRDSHDRYANIEISYLLQRMEEYDGMVILASNLHKNMDDAFVRRMHFTVEFPFPNEKQRRRIWEKIWPAQTPLSPSLDLGYMARRFEMAGGNIRNIALAAAFFAADDGEIVNMPHLIRAVQREYQKMGKVVVNGEFDDYANYIR